jgi:hypothetical protein
MCCVVCWRAASSGVQFTPRCAPPAHATPDTTTDDDGAGGGSSRGGSSRGGGGGSGGPGTYSRIKEKNRLAQQRFRQKQKNMVSTLKQRLAELEEQVCVCVCVCMCMCLCVAACSQHGMAAQPAHTPRTHTGGPAAARG